MNYIIIHHHSFAECGIYYALVMEEVNKTQLQTVLSVLQ